MHQTFYIDVDEEVNSIITRIRKSSAKYNILVVTNRALIMQSAVSLKLIKREAERLDKRIIFVTKDERAMAVAKKIGFVVKNSLEELRGVISDNDLRLKSRPVSLRENISSGEEEKNNNSRRVSLDNLGAESFITPDKRIDSNFKKEDIKSIPGNHQSFQDEKDKNVEVRDKTQRELSSRDEEIFDDFFSHSSEEEIIDKGNKKAERGGYKFIWIFLSILIFLLLAIGAYFYLPEARVKVFPKKEEKVFNIDLRVGENNKSSLNTEASILLKPIIFEEESLLSLSFPATGQKGSSSQKAKGKITIYNEFGETSQVLVATTRFVSGEGKVFRLINSVTVPGMTIKDGQNEPGKIEAEIIADEAGESYNLREAEFKIPGFEGSPKYDKFYARLSEETKGGGSTGETSGLKTVSSTDIENAKIKTESQLKNQLKENIKQKAGEENVLLEDAFAFEVIDYSVFPGEDSVTENFEYQVKIKIKSLAFSAQELEQKVNDYINQKTLQESINMKTVSLEKQYGRAEIDFGSNSIKTELKIKTVNQAEVNEKDLIAYLVNKNKSEADAILEDFSGIKKVEFLIKPNFLSNKFPGYQSRIKVEIVNDAD
ncbi:MAG: hypothetical protein V3574_02245 [Candidatus Moraniibacteriota bacterium]